MPIDEIPRFDWKKFCDGFSRLHHGWVVDVECVDSGQHEGGPLSEMEAQILSHDEFNRPADSHAATAAAVRPKILLQDVALKGVQVAPCPTGEEQIVIAGEARGGKQLTHAVDKPTRLRLEHTEEGADEALYIDSGRHTVALRFPITAPMEALDGFVPV